MPSQVLPGTPFLQWQLDSIVCLKSPQDGKDLHSRQHTAIHMSRAAIKQSSRVPLSAELWGNGNLLISKLEIVLPIQKAQFVLGSRKATDLSAIVRTDVSRVMRGLACKGDQGHQNDWPWP